VGVWDGQGHTTPGSLYEYQKKGVAGAGVCMSMKTKEIAGRQIRSLSRGASRRTEANWPGGPPEWVHGSAVQRWADPAREHVAALKRNS